MDQRRKFKIYFYLFVATLSSITIYGCSQHRENIDLIFQTSTIHSLLEGGYDGHTTFEDLKKNGDFGLGTFNDLDGEMIGLDGKFYQIKADGIANPVPDSEKTPFAVVTFFEPDKTLLLNKSLDCKHLEEYLDDLLQSKSVLYAIKIQGSFKYVKTRSVPRQNKPYPRLLEVLKSQPTFEFNNVDGTIVGFWFPTYMKGLNVPGYHFHFITKYKKAGGHILECQIEDVSIEIDLSSELFLSLPEHSGK